MCDRVYSGTPVPTEGLRLPGERLTGRRHQWTLGWVY